MADSEPVDTTQQVTSKPQPQNRKIQNGSPPANLSLRKQNRLARHKKRL